MKVCILAAGIGSRNKYSYNINKGLLTLGDKAIISKIMDQFPEKTEFIIPVGHLYQTIFDYFKIINSDKNITFVKINDYMTKGSGPG